MSNKKEKPSQPDKHDGSGSGIAVGMCFGVAIGVALGSAMDNIGLWLPVGIGIGLCFGSAFEAQNKKKNSTDGEAADKDDEVDDNEGEMP